VSINFEVSLLIFYLNDPYIGQSGELKCPTIVVLESMLLKLLVFF
jgi:hypothetical protein